MIGDARLFDSRRGRLSFRELMVLDEHPVTGYYGALVGQKKEIASHGIEPPFFAQYRKLRERFGSEGEFKKAFPGMSMEKKAYEVASNFFPLYKYSGLERDPAYLNELNFLVFGVPISLDLDCAARHACAAEGMGGMVIAVEVDKPYSRIESVRSGCDDTVLLVQGVIGLEGKLRGVYYSEGAKKYKDELDAAFSRFNTDISPLSEVSPRQGV